MGWPKGRARTPGSGRKPGARNLRTVALAERVAELKLPDPVIRLLVIGVKAEKDGDLELAVDAYGKAAPYLSPRLNAIDVKTDDGKHKPIVYSEEGLKASLIEMWKQAATCPVH